MELNLAHRHAPGVQLDDLVVKARPTGLVLGNELALEAAMAVAGLRTMAAVSTTKCASTQCKWGHFVAVEHLMRSLPAQASAGSVVEPVHGLEHLLLAGLAQIAALGEVVA